ncbi:MAG: hypothetical protein MJ237_03680 [bacterium]|nr:hypothetical protein [bacterium]
MKKNLLFALCLVSFACVNSTQAIEVKKPNLTTLRNVTNAVTTTATTNKTTTTANSAQTVAKNALKSKISTINNKVAATDKSVQNAFTSLVSTCSSKEDAAKIKAKVNSINLNKNLTAEQKREKIAELMLDYNNTLKSSKSKVSSELQSASAAKKAQLQNSVTAMKNASSQYLSIANDCKGVISDIGKTPSLMITASDDLANLKNIMSGMKDSAKALNKLAAQTVSVANSAKITLK